MKTKNIFFALALAALSVTSVNSFAALAPKACAPNVLALVASSTYKDLAAMLTASDVNALKSAMHTISDATQYQALLDLANGISTKTSARVVVTLPDGTVVVDTKKATNNTYDNFVAKAINENHNTRIAFLDAQLWPCGVGVESKYSTSTGTKEIAVAKRIGNYLDSVGTIRISK